MGAAWQEPYEGPGSPDPAVGLGAPHWAPVAQDVTPAGCVRLAESAWNRVWVTLDRAGVPPESTGEHLLNTALHCPWPRDRTGAVRQKRGPCVPEASSRLRAQPHPGPPQPAARGRARLFLLGARPLPARLKSPAPGAMAQGVLLRAHRTHVLSASRCHPSGHPCGRLVCWGLREFRSRLASWVGTGCPTFAEGRLHPLSLGRGDF